MYRQRPFVSEDTAHLYDLIEQARVGYLVATLNGNITASLIPVMVDRDQGCLLGHLARANPLCDIVRAAGRVTWLFTACDAYISPSMYPSKERDPRVVPTWDYQSVEVQGVATIHDDPTIVLDLVERLTIHHEHTRATPWSVSDAPKEFTQRSAGAIVGVTVLITEMFGTDKLSQNRSDEDRRGVEAALMASNERDRAVGEALFQLRAHQ